MRKIRLSKNHKFRSQQKFNQVNSFRFYTGIVVGLISAFTIYSFTYVIRESLILFSRTEDCDVWSFTDSEMNFYNFFFAFLSVIIAQSFIINFWLNKPRSFFGRYEYKRKYIINEQRTFNWYFISWFSKMSVVFFVFFGMTIEKGYYILSFYDEYKYIFILIMIVLFLQTWNSLRLTFLKRSLFKMLIAAITVSILSFGMSKINIIDYKKINSSYKKSCCEECIPENLPRVKYFNKFHGRMINIYMNDKTLNSPDSLIKINDEVSSIYDLSDILMQYFANHSYYYRYYRRRHVNAKLYIESNIKMKDVNFIKSVLAEYDIMNVVYTALPENIKYDKKYYYDYGVPSRISPSYLSDSIINQFSIIENVKESPKLNLKADSIGNVFIDEIVIDNDSLSRVIKTKVYKNNKLLCMINVENEMTFETYFKMWYAYYEAIYELRAEYANVYFTKKFNDLNGEDLDVVYKEYPFKVFEMTNRMKKLF